jgi:NADH-quinone oxidoreductase subunit F
VDLKLMTAEPSAEERAAVDEVLGRPDSGWEGGDRTPADLRVARAPEDRRTMLLPVLHALQANVGWISEGGLNYACERLVVPPAEAYGVATFYAMFSVQPRPRTVVHVCDDLACRLSGGVELLEAAGAAQIDGVEVSPSPCLGMCEQAPAVLAQRAGRPDVALGEVTVDGIRAVSAPDSTVTCAGAVTAPQVWDDGSRDALRLLARAGVVDPLSIDDYREHGGYTALGTALEIGPDAVIQQVTDAKLLGRGGAAFPTGVKWRAVADQPPGPRFVICNADESEPGTFKDRLLMEHDPFAVIESLTIAGYATGAERGYLYVRGEYPLATERIEGAIESARAAARALTSAAKRRPCSTPSRARGGSPGTSHRSPSRTGSSADPRRSTTSRPWSTCP